MRDRLRSHPVVIRMLLAVTLGCCGLTAAIQARAQPQPAPDVAAGAEEESDGLFVRPDDDPGGRRSQRAIDPATPALVFGAVQEIEVGAERALYRLHAQDPGVLTLMLDSPGPARVELFTADGTGVLATSDVEGAEFFGLQRAGVAQSPQGHTGRDVQTPMYILYEAGDYLLELRFEEASDDHAFLGASWLAFPMLAQTDQGLGPGQAAVNPKEAAVAIAMDRWQPVPVAGGEQGGWIKLTPQEAGTIVVMTRTQGGGDAQLVVFLEDQFDEPITYADNDPLGRMGDESVTIAAKAGKVYYIQISGYELGTVRVRAMRFPDALPLAPEAPQPPAPADTPELPQPPRPEPAE